MLHLGTIAYFDRDFERARELWTRSLGYEMNGHAMRNLALLDEFEGDAKEAAAKMVHALEMIPASPHFMDDACRLLVASADWEALKRLLDRQPPILRYRPRARLALALAQAAVAGENLDSARAYFDAPCDLVDIREAETSLTDLWRALGETAALPPQYDFRMVRDGTTEATEATERGG